MAEELEKVVKKSSILNFEKCPFFTVFGRFQSFSGDSLRVVANFERSGKLTRAKLRVG